MFSCMFLLKFAKANQFILTSTVTLKRKGGGRYFLLKYMDNGTIVDL